MKVRRKKTASAQDTTGNIQAEIIGTSETSYNFTSMYHLHFINSYFSKVSTIFY